MFKVIVKVKVEWNAKQRLNQKTTLEALMAESAKKV